IPKVCDRSRSVSSWRAYQSDTGSRSASAGSPTPRESIRLLPVRGTGTAPCRVSTADPQHNWRHYGKSATTWSSASDDGWIRCRRRTLLHAAIDWPEGSLERQQGAAPRIARVRPRNAATATPGTAGAGPPPALVSDYLQVGLSRSSNEAVIVPSGLTVKCTLSSPDRL